jgi:ADP-ribose pyrophosphatase YjhB (NUDIX family)
MSSQTEFFSKLAQERRVRVSVRSIAIRDQMVLLQRPTDEPESCLAFIGGALEYGELMEDRLRAEYSEEFGIVPVTAEYLFVVENRFEVGDRLIHGLEHYFEVGLPAGDVAAREPELTPVWVAMEALATADVRPRVVRDAIVDGSYRSLRRLAT